MKHTRGPWFVGTRADQTIWSGDLRVANVECARKEWRSNARLIGTAPDMLGTLEAANCPVWVHNAATTNDIEALRRIALWYAGWWNTQAMPTLIKAKGE